MVDFPFRAILTTYDQKTGLCKDNFVDVKTSVSNKDICAPVRPMTPEERFEQRVSFVYGQLSEYSPLTKEDVRRILSEQI
jgi:hypothetical protein